MLTKAGAKLLDFGVAKLQADPVDRRAVADRDVRAAADSRRAMVGTLQYMAPEQLDGRAVDARTDLFAFGALVHEMSTGRKAFDASSQSSLAAAIRGEHPPPISTLQPLSPPALDRVVQKCLAKDPDDRWQTARDLADALKWISQDTFVRRPRAGRRRRRPHRRDDARWRSPPPSCCSRRWSGRRLALASAGCRASRRPIFVSCRRFQASTGAPVFRRTDASSRF